VTASLYDPRRTPDLPDVPFDPGRFYFDLARTRPIAYTKKILGINPWRKQRDILRAFVDPAIDKIAWRSGNGVGKTFLLASLICNYLDTHAPGYVVVSGASWTGILKTIWPTLRRVVRGARVPLGGKVLGTEWRRGEMWGAFCVSPDEPENFGGFRTENGALVLVDEASALSYSSMEAILGVCSAAGSKIVLTGNPLRPEGPFFDAFQSSEWETFHTSSIEAAKTKIPGLATEEWCEAMANEYGRESNVYSARVLGQFPGGGADNLISLSWLKHIITPKVARPRGTRIMGVDVARFGDDRTVLIIRDDRCVLGVFCYAKKSTMETVGLIQKHADEFGVRAEDIMVDDTGLGGGVTDRLHELGHEVLPVNFGERALDRERFLNCRAELYWALRGALKPDSEKRLLIPKQWASLAKECTWPRYKIRSDRLIQLEGKDEIKKRKKRSPDEADALALTFYRQTNEFTMEAA